MAESLENSPSLYLGKPWSDWANKVEDEDELNRSKHSSGHAESMRLKRDDMPLFGLCPAQDEFYLVVCETCKQVVKPQALLRHMEVRHGRKSKNHSPRRRRTSSISSTPRSPTLSPPRDDKRVHSGSKSSKHDAHGKPPDDGGGGTSRSSHDGSGFKSSPSKHHHALPNATLSLRKADKFQRNHSMPVVKMERLPPTMSAKNNAPTLHMPPSSNHKPANSTTKPNKSNSKEHRDKSKVSSSHLSHGHEPSHHSSKGENHDTKSASEAKSIKDNDLSRLSDDEDLFSLSSLQSKIKSESSSLSKVKSESKHNDVEKHDVNSTTLNDVSPHKKHSVHSHSSHHSSDGSKSSKHKHGHSGERSSSSKHSKHEHSDGSSKQKQDKNAWGGSGRSKSPDKNEGSSSSKHNSSKFSSKSEWNKHNDKHEGSNSAKHNSSKISDSGKQNKGNDSGKQNSSVLSDKQWNDITKLNSTKSNEKPNTVDFVKVEDSPEINIGLDDITKFNGTPLSTPLISSKSDSPLKPTHNSSKSSKHSSSDGNLDNSEKSVYRPPALNLSLTSSSSCEGSTGKPSLTSPTTPVLTSPESSVPTTPIMTPSTKHLDKIDINSPTSTFGKKLAAFQNPGKLLPCKDREYNPDIHCGVIGKEDNKPCTRSLTCKSHALSLRRAVTGRCKPFDELLLEHRAAKEAYLLSKKEAGHAVGGKSSSNKTPSVSKSSSLSSVSKIKSPPAPAAIATKSPSMHSLPQRVPSMTSPPPPPIKMPKLPVSTTPNAVHRVLPLTIQLPPKPAQIADLPASEPVPVPELFTPSATSDNEDDDDYRDRTEYPQLPHHPRPAVVNCFGGRNTGSGCYVFNRKTDQLRAVFRLAVDRRLHPPPHKKLCLDSKLPVSSNLSSSSKDPYEFGTGSPHITAKGAKSNKSHKSPGSAGNKSHKAKEDVGGINYSAVYEPFDSKGGSHLDATAIQGVDVFTTGQPTITTAAGLISQSSSARSSSGGGGSGGPAAKRKRSGSSPRPALSTSNSNATASIGGFALNSANNAISIAIPTGSLNLNLSSTTLNSLNATFAGNKLSQLAANKNNMIKDVNIMVTGGTSTVLNGQILTSIPSSNLTDVTQIQLKNSLSSPPSQKSKSRKRTSSRSTSGSGGAQDGAAAGAQTAASVVNAISGGAVFMDSSPAALIASNSVAMVTTSGFGMMSAPVTSPSPAMTPSPLFTAGPASSIPNGIIGQQGVKSMTSLNHVGSAAVTESPVSHDGSASPVVQVAPLSDTTLNTLEHHTPSMSSKHSKKQKHLKALQQQHHQVAPPPFTSQPSRLITSSVPYGIHGNTMGVPGALSGSGYSHIQIQPKDLASGGTGKTLATGKLSMQPMSLTIPLMAPGPLPEGLTVMQGQGQQRALLIPAPESTERGHHHHTHESIPQLTLQNSPSNLIS